MYTPTQDLHLLFPLPGTFWIFQIFRYMGSLLPHSRTFLLECHWLRALPSLLPSPTALYTPFPVYFSSLCWSLPDIFVNVYGLLLLPRPLPRQVLPVSAGILSVLFYSQHLEQQMAYKKFSANT